MPRRKAVDDGEDGASAPQAATKPEGMSERQWAIGAVLGNVSLAGALIDVTDGKRPPHDDQETTALMNAARKLEARSYRRYRTLKSTLGTRLDAAQRDNADHLGMLQVLRDIEQYGSAGRPGMSWENAYGVAHGQEANGGPSDSIPMDITGPVGGTVGGAAVSEMTSND